MGVKAFERAWKTSELELLAETFQQIRDALERGQA
jgi:hypothetical protein